MTGGAPLRLLVADDHPGFRLLVRTALAGAPGVEIVGEAASVAAVEETAASLRPDAALIDLMLPGGGAFAAVQGLRDLTPECTTIVCSAHGIEELEVTGNVGGVAFLSKGISPLRLAEALAELVAVMARTEPALEEATISLPREHASSGAARRFAVSALEGWDCADLTETVRLLVSELVSNAIIHAGTEVTLTMKLLPDRVRVEVSDRSPQQMRRREASDEDTSGRGSELVDLLARAWGLVGQPDGKCIWFELDRPETGPMT